MKGYTIMFSLTNILLVAAGWACGMGSYRYLLTTSWGANWIEVQAAKVAAAKAALQDQVDKVK